MLLFIMSAILFTLLFLCMGLIFRKNKTSIHALEKRQTRNYNMLFIGTTCISLVPVMLMALFVTLLTYIRTDKLVLVGFLIFILFIPFFIIMMFSTSAVVLLLLMLRPTMYMKNERKKDLGYIAIGVISLLLLPIYIYFTDVLISLALFTTSLITSSTELLELDTFYPAIALYILFAGGPIFLIIGGIYRMKTNKSVKGNENVS